MANLNPHTLVITLNENWVYFLVETKKFETRLKQAPNTLLVPGAGVRRRSRALAG